ncbi:hypothetical protein PR202_ga03564 [Eleusine coracana subsp. coracana]|uniref:Uncharacterized protein n=1 Tax=Eleusine coracana subsp. coracana TaxID=191504 RepID=A0AAV5BPA4_ELECO|nr:hypothetical protein PR202_ga03564 [Eleusine coracana subsp. coracana]
MGRRAGGGREAWADARGHAPVRRRGGRPVHAKRESRRRGGERGCGGVQDGEEARTHARASVDVRRRVQAQQQCAGSIGDGCAGGISDAVFRRGGVVGARLQARGGGRG